MRQGWLVAGGHDPEALLREGRAAYHAGAWGRARELLTDADEASALHPDDLDRLAVAAALTGHADAAAAARERAHVAWLELGDIPRAVRSAFWLAVLLMDTGQHAQAGGWLARADRALGDLDCAERGYLMVPPSLRALYGGEPRTALDGFDRVAAVADRHPDADLVAMARLGQGQALLDLGDAGRGVANLDEAMVAVTTGEVTPLLAGIVYCGVIIACRKVFDVRRAREWTVALTKWCDAQPDLQPYRGQCLVHRSEVLQLGGDWHAALAEVDQACAHLSRVPRDPVMGMAQYQRGELHRVRGTFATAEACYREASQWGHPVQPGLALLRLAQGRHADAEAAIRRVVEEHQDRVRRARVLAAHVEIMLTVGDGVTARGAADELADIADSFASPYLRAVARHARGWVELSAGEPAAAIVVLQEAAAAWRELDAPYDLARTQVLLSRACRQLGDGDTADLELAAARRVFEQLGARPALDELRQLRPAGARPAPGGLTARELEVLRLVAKGRTNRDVAHELVISEKTVARHLSNIFTKLGVGSRAAATAWAYEHDLA